MATLTTAVNYIESNDALGVLDVLAQRLTAVKLAHKLIKVMYAAKPCWVSGNHVSREI